MFIYFFGCVSFYVAPKMMLNIFFCIQHQLSELRRANKRVEIPLSGIVAHSVLIGSSQNFEAILLVVQSVG